MVRPPAPLLDPLPEVGGRPWEGIVELELNPGLLSPTFDTVGDVCNLLVAPDVDDKDDDEQVDDDDELAACSGEKRKSQKIMTPGSIYITNKNQFIKDKNII